MSNRTRAELEAMATEIQALEFDTVFTVECTDEATRLTFPDNVWAPTVTHDDASDVSIDGDEWEALTGFTGQHGYSGAVNHPSEFVGSGIASELTRLAEDEPQTFVLVVVDSDDPDDDPCGWAILHRT